ncbi:1-acyl-sn-glycerol-3-phosphate acyltransferase 3 [Linum perenne]
MGFPAAIAIVPIGIVFFVSGLAVNFIQAVVFLTLRPFSKSLYRRVNKVVAELLWLELIWLFDWWANLKVEVYADDETFSSLGKEHGLLICNHRSDVDWLVGWVLAQRSGCLGSALAVMKREAKWLPIIGWSMWFSDYVFLARNWAKDEITLKSGLERLVDFPMPFWLALFAEGTRFTQAKLEAAQEFAASRGLPIPRNVLLPRTKINVHIKRHSMQELPETADGISQWCKDIFIAKDDMLDKFLTKDTFSDRKRDIGRPKKPLYVFIVWSALLVWGIANLFQWLSHLGSWEGITFVVTVLVIVTIGMHILIQSSESGHSSTGASSADVIVVTDGVQDRLINK